MIEVDMENKKIAVDHETYKRMTQGTAFQRSINCLALMFKEMDDFDDFLFKTKNVPKKMQKKIIKKMRAERVAYFRSNPPPGIDMEALDMFLSCQ